MDPLPSDLSAVDSTAELLQDLHLLGPSRHGKHTDTMEIDLMLEAPDEPDKMACPVEDIGKEATAKAYHRSYSNLSLRGEGTSSSNALCNKSLFRKARLASSINKSRDVKFYHVGKKSSLGLSYPTKCRSDRRKVKLDLHGDNEASSSDCLNSVESSPSGPIERTNYGLADSLELSDGARAKEMNEIAVSSVLSEHSTNCVAESNCNENRLSLTSDSQAMTAKAASRHFPGRFERRRLVRYGLISPDNIKRNFPSVNGQPSSSYVERTAVDKGKGIDLPNNSQSESEHTLFQQHQFDIPWKNSGWRRVQQHRCISSSNIANNFNVTEWKQEGIGKLDSHEVRDDFSLNQLHVVGPNLEPRQTNEVREQVSLNNDLHAKDTDAKSTIMSSRELLLPGKEKMISAGASADNMSFRTMHTHTGKATQLSSHESLVVSNRKDDQHEKTVVEGINVNMIHARHGIGSLEAAGPSSCPNETNPSQAQVSTEINFEISSEDGGDCGAEVLTRGKRKFCSHHTLLGESSHPAITEVDVSHLQSPVKPTRGRSSWCRGVKLRPVIDCDEPQSPLSRNTSDQNCRSSEESVAKALQVESDEIIARQLQEQFFNESSDFGGAEEIDATIAWTLQQEEDAQHASFIRNQGPSFSRNPSIAHLYRQYPRESSQSSLGRSTSRAPITPSGRMAQLRRNMRYERLNFLEALEVSSSNGNDLRSNILQVHRDFNEDDYEMLLTLDDDNHQHMGASDRHINSLPQTVIQIANAEEACAICLEQPSVGDTIRHLPCLHKFHKDCIDTWLRRRTLCPICKSAIS